MSRHAEFYEDFQRNYNPLDPIYNPLDPITGLPIETNGAIDLWADHEIVRNNLWDRWVTTSARQYLDHCWTLK